jgi:hypothetical protein
VTVLRDRGLRRCCGSARGTSSPHAAGCQVAAQERRARKESARWIERCHAEALKEQARRAAGWRPDVEVEMATADVAPDWSSTCEVCGGTPVMPVTGLCGPCTTGEAETIGGDW